MCDLYSPHSLPRYLSCHEMSTMTALVSNPGTHLNQRRHMLPLCSIFRDSKTFKILHHLAARLSPGFHHMTCSKKGINHFILRIFLLLHFLICMKFAWEIRCVNTAAPSAYDHFWCYLCQQRPTFKHWLLPCGNQRCPQLTWSHFTGVTKQLV